MKSKIYFPVLFFFIFFQSSIYAVHTHQSAELREEQSSLQQTIPLNRAQLEAQLGRELKLKERIGLSLFKSAIGKNIHQAKSGHQPAAEGVGDGFAIAGFLIGILSLFVAGILLGIVAVIFSTIAIGRIKKKGTTGRGFAIAALILGLVGIVGGAIAIAAAI